MPRCLWLEQGRPDKPAARRCRRAGSRARRTAICTRARPGSRSGRRPQLVRAARRPARDHRRRRRVRHPHDDRPADQAAVLQHRRRASSRSCSSSSCASATGGPCKYTGRDMATLPRRHGARRRRVHRARREPRRRARQVQGPGEGEGRAARRARPAQAADRRRRPTSCTRSPTPSSPRSATLLAATLKDKAAAELLAAAVVAGKRGQRSYAEQLFSRAEMIVGPPAVAAAPPRCSATARRRASTPRSRRSKDTAPQPTPRRQVRRRRAEQEAARPARCTAR